METMQIFFALIVALGAIGSVPGVEAECQCGYASSVDQTVNVFTDVLESDFLHIPNIALDTDWRRQDFNVTAAAGRGPYGMNFTIENVVSNPIPDGHNFSGPGKFGANPGLQFSVGGGVPVTGYVQVSEMDSAREDLLWGTYRAAMKLTLTPGTCSAFFWVQLHPSCL
jgi:hypothetical protein